MTTAICLMPKIITGTTPSSPLIDVGIARRVGVSLRAMGFPFSKQALHTLVVVREMSLPSDSLQMTGINTGGIFTSMVDINFLRERTKEIFVNPTMGVNAPSGIIGSTTNLEYTIPLWVSEGSPFPTSFSFVDFLPKPSKDRYAFSKWCSSHNSSITDCRNKCNTQFPYHQKSDKSTSFTSTPMKTVGGLEMAMKTPKNQIRSTKQNG